MDTSMFRTAMPSVTDVYTDLNGLQNLKNENDDAALRKVAQQFESMFINMLMKNMRSANDVFSEGNFFDTAEIKFYRDMHDNQLALSLAHSEGFGIAEAMYRQISSNKNGHQSREIFDPHAIVAAQAYRNRTDLVSSVEASQSKPAQDPVQAVASATSFSTDTNSDSENRYALANSPEEFVNKVLPGAQKIAPALGVDAETLVAQAALETGWGAKVFADETGKPTFNLFNIKAGSGWQGDAVYKSSLEFLGGKFTSVASKFRSYASVEESFEDFSQFILGSERYQDAVETAGSGIDFIRKIHSAGYATDPSYVEKVASVYERVKSLVAGGQDEL